MMPIALFSLALLCVLGFIGAAVVSYAATRRRDGRAERRAGDMAIVFFLAALPLIPAGAAADVRFLFAGYPILGLIAIIGFLSRPHCPKCGEGLNLLTNRQFRRATCVFCGATVP